MTYEEFLVARRETGATVDSELERVSQLSKVAKEVKANHQLSAWLERHAGAINVITDKDDAVAEVIRLKASAEVIGIDIETAKASDYTEHLQAGLHPKVSRIRLVQLFQDRGNGVTIIDCFAAGYDWLLHLQGGSYVAHNAQFECAHFWHHYQVELGIDCTMLAGRVFYGDLKKLSELATEHLNLGNR